MPMTATDIKFFESGTQNLGGAIQVTEVSGALNDFFDRVSGSESVVGAVEYRCFYVKNTHALLTLFDAKVYISDNTNATSTDVAIGLGLAGIGVGETELANETTAPAGVTFSLAVDEANALVVGDLSPGDYQAIWVRRTVGAGAGAIAVDGSTVTVAGDSEI